MAGGRPADLKAAKTLANVGVRVERLRVSGVRVNTRHVWRGWNDEAALLLDTPQGAVARKVDAVVLALAAAVGRAWV